MGFFFGKTTLLSTMTNSVSRTTIFLGIICPLIAFIIYYPGLSGAFAFDDVPNLLKNKSVIINNLQIEQLVTATFSSGFSGPLGRPVAMLSFALNHYAAGGFDPYWFKLFNIILHLVNGASLFLLTLLLLTTYRRTHQLALSDRHIRLLSLAIMAGWLLHPINLTGVLYVVQRMTSLSAFFVIWGLIIYIWARSRPLSGKTSILFFSFSFALIWLLAIFSKENGLLLPLFILIVELTILRFQTTRPLEKRSLVTFFVATLALPALGLLISLLVDPNRLLGGYALRDFDLTQRLLTEARVLWYYAQLILFPRLSEFGLFHDDIIISRSFFDPPSTGLAVIGLIGVFLLAIYSIKRAPIFAFGILFFLSGHALESTIFPLELIHEHRNYLPCYGLIFTLFYYLLYPIKYLKSFRLRHISAFLYLIIIAFITFHRANYWGNPLEHVLTEQRNHPNSPRANASLGDLYLDLASANNGDDKRISDWLDLARQHFEHATELQKNYTDGLFSLIEMDSKFKSTVSDKWIQKLNNRLEHQPFAANNVNRIANLVICHIENTCKLETQSMISIIQAAQRNPALKGGIKAELYFISSKYAIEKLHDLEAGIYFMAQAIHDNPKDLRYRLQLVKFLIILNRFEDAREELNKARQLSLLSNYTDEIKEYNRQLNARSTH